MKIIDLLNKIANGEEVPKRIKIKDEIWAYDDGIDYKASDGRGYLFEVHTRTNKDDLNEEVKILEEEKKIPEKLNKKHFHKKQRQLANKINEIIDTLEMLNDKIK